MTTTTTKPHKTRWQEISEIWHKDKWLYGVIGGLAGFIVGIAASDYLGQFVTWFWNGFWNEALSIAITVIILDRLNKFRAEQERKEELMFQLGSNEQVIAKQALMILKQKGWLMDGSLRSANLWKANLQKADFFQADLAMANLYRANLERARFREANLQGANLQGANLQGAYFREANLTGANLNKAYLEYSNWQDETIGIESAATLPDGSKWTPNRDMREFTHPEEWSKGQDNVD